MMSYVNETDFVIENKELVYPEIITDGLQLYYDAKGKRDTDYHRDTMLDMSGNKNHGKLHNFAYEKHSGYKDGLVFDYIDDKLVRPSLNLQPNDFTFMLNSNIISFSPDGTVKRIQDGEVIESKGFNLLQNGDFSEGIEKWSVHLLGTKFNSQGVEISLPVDGNNRFIKNNSIDTFKTGHTYYIHTKLKALSFFHPAHIRHYINSDYRYPALQGVQEGETAVLSNTFIGDAEKANNFDVRLFRGSDDTEIKKVQIHYSMMIDLTEAFGAGNEPTKEEMDEIINRFGFIPNAQDLIDRIEYKGNDLGDMENIIDGLYKTEVLPGEEIFTDEADDDALVHVEVDGNSYQPNYITNLFTKKTVSGDAYSINTDVRLKIIQGHQYYTRRTFTSDSTAGSFGSIRILGTDTHMFIPNGQSGDFSQITTYTGQTRTGEVMFYGSNAAPSGGKIENTFIIDLTSHFGLGNEPSRDEMDKITDALGWFSGNKVYSERISESRTIPTLDYPIEIHSLNDFDVVSSVGKENIVVNSDFSMGINMWGSYTGMSDFRLEDSRLKFTATSAASRIRYHGLPPLSYTPRNYFVTIEYNSSVDPMLGGKTGSTPTAEDGSQNIGSTATISTTVINGNHKRRVFKWVSATRVDESNIIHPWFTFTFRNAGEAEIIKLKVEESNEPTQYNPSPEDILESDNHPLIDKINLLLDEPLRSIEDVKDRLFRDSDGVWKIERNIAIVSVADISSWVSVSASYQTATTSQIGGTPSKIAKRYTQPISSHFRTGAHAGAGDALGIAIVGNFPQFRIKFDNNQIGVNPDSTLEERLDSMRNWLNDNSNTVIQYERDEKLVEILPQLLQDKLNNLRSFSESNYVYTVSGDTNLLNTVPLLNNYWYPFEGIQQEPQIRGGHTATQEPLPVYPGARMKLTKSTTTDNFWRIVWVDKSNSLIIRITPTDNDLILTAPTGAYGMRVSYPNGSNAVIKFDKPDISQTVYENLKPTLHAKFLYNNWYKEDRVINNLMIYNRALTNEEILQNYKTIKRRWGM